MSFAPDFIKGNARISTLVFRVGCAGLCAIVSVLELRRARRARIGPTLWHWLMLAFWAGYLARTIFYYQVQNEPAPMPLRDFLAYAYGVSFSGVVAMMAVRRPEQLQRAPYICVALCGVACLLTLFYGIGNYNTEMAGRLFANERLNPISLGHVATTLILSALWLLATGGQLAPRGAISINTLQRAAPRSMSEHMIWFVRFPLSIGLIVLGLYVLGLSASRGPTIALVAGLLLFFLRRRTQLVIVALAAIIVMLIVVKGGLVESILSQGFNLDRLSQLGFIPDDYQEGGRTSLYLEAWQLFIRHPFTGSTLFLSSLQYPHNLVLEALMALGAVGGGILTVLLVNGFVVLWRISKNHEVGLWLLLIYGQSVVGTLLSGSIYYDPLIWATLAATIGLAGPWRVQAGPMPFPPPAKRTVEIRNR